MTSFWKNRNVFVTGATGLLGSALTHDLLQRGANVICLIRDYVPASGLVRSHLIDRVTCVSGSLEDYETVLRAVNEYEINTVFHLGAQTIVGTAARSALSTFESNIRGTWTLLEACRQCAKTVERVVVASSDKAYGEHDKLPYTEETPLVGRYPYDVSKSCADLIALSYFHTYRLPVAVTRCGNLFGGGDLNFSRLIPGAIRSALNAEPPVIRSDGQYVRDYFYVRDASLAYIRLAEAMPSDVAGEAFNFGNETPVTVLEIVRRILHLMQSSYLQPIILNQSSNEIPRQFLDCSKARRVLGWTPRYPLDDALMETIDWYRTRESGRLSVEASHATA
jgi:CDP-glucose 4,6-dehydratase